MPHANITQRSMLELQHHIARPYLPFSSFFTAALGMICLGLNKPQGLRASGHGIQAAQQALGTGQPKLPRMVISLAHIAYLMIAPGQQVVAMTIGIL